MALEALYATEVVREAFMCLFNLDESGCIFLDSDDGSDEDEDWEDNMDLLTFARYYAGPSNPHFVKMVQGQDLESGKVALGLHCMDNQDFQQTSMCKDQSVFPIPSS